MTDLKKIKQRLKQSRMIAEEPIRFLRDEEALYAAGHKVKESAQAKGTQTVTRKVGQKVRKIPTSTTTRQTRKEVEESTLKRSIYGGGGTQKFKGRKPTEKEAKEFVRKVKGVSKPDQKKIDAPKKGSRPTLIQKLAKINPRLVTIYKKQKKGGKLTKLEQKTWKDYKMKKQPSEVQTQQARYPSIGSKETTLNGVTGKWITIKGRKLFIPKP